MFGRFIFQHSSDFRVVEGRRPDDLPKLVCGTVDWDFQIQVAVAGSGTGEQGKRLDFAREEKRGLDLSVELPSGHQLDGNTRKTPGSTR